MTDRQLQGGAGSTRARIVAEAISDRGGPLSMRRLADRLDVPPMALYAHVDDKDDLLDEILDATLARLALPQPPGADWRAWMLSCAEQLHAVLSERPDLLERYTRRPVG